MCPNNNGKRIECMTDDEIGKEVKGCCPSCGPNRFAHIRASQYKYYDDEFVPASVTYRILECDGCHDHYIQTECWCSEDYHDEPPRLEHWPIYLKYQPPSWLKDVYPIDSELHTILTELYSAASHDLHVCAAIAIRTAFDRAAQKLRVDPSGTFNQKLDQLESKGYLGVLDKVVLNTIVNAGNAAAHRGWKPKADELKTLIASLESFIHRAFILNDAVNKIKKRVPAKPKTKKASTKGAKRTVASKSSKP
jgi:hypothetical protein